MFYNIFTSIFSYKFIYNHDIIIGDNQETQENNTRSQDHLGAHLHSPSYKTIKSSFFSVLFKNILIR